MGCDRCADEWNCDASDGDVTRARTGYFTPRIARGGRPIAAGRIAAVLNDGGKATAAEAARATARAACVDLILVATSVRTPE